MLPLEALEEDREAREEKAGISYYHFLQLHVNLQRSQNKKFTYKIIKMKINQSVTKIQRLIHKKIVLNNFLKCWPHT